MSDKLKLDFRFAKLYSAWFNADINGRLDFSPTGSTFACANHAGVVELWELGASAPQLRRLLGKGDQSYSCSAALRISPLGNLLVADGHTAGHVKLWPLHNIMPAKEKKAENPPLPIEQVAEKEAKELPLAISDITVIDFSANGAVLACAGSPGKIGIWDMRGESPREKTAIQTNFWTGYLALSADGAIVACCRHHKPEIRLWDISKEEPSMLPLLHHQTFARRPAFSPNGKLFACGSGGLTQFWEVSGTNFKKLATLPEDFLAFSPESDRVITGLSTGKISVWNIADKQVLWTCELPGPVHKAMFAPDGRHLATLNSNGTIYICRLQSAPARTTQTPR